MGNALRARRDQGREPMLRRFQASFVLLVCLASIPAAAEEEEPPPTASQLTPTTATTQVKPVAELGPWHMEVSGYFRAPVAMGLSSRPGPDNMAGPSSTQVSYGPNRTVD